MIPETHRAEITWGEYQRLKEIERLARAVLDDLEKFGPSIVPHPIDTDDNDGQRLREALCHAKIQGGE